MDQKWVGRIGISIVGVVGECIVVSATFNDKIAIILGTMVIATLTGLFLRLNEGFKTI